MNVQMQYGKTGLEIEVPFTNVTILRPQFVPGLAAEADAFAKAVRRPIESAPLAELIAPDDTVAVVIADITRALPSARLLPWLLAELNHVPAAQFTIIIGTGTHRACTPAEIEALVGPDIAQRCRVTNHNAFDDATMDEVGKVSGHGASLKLNSAYVQADKRIIIGFIEPHFMAGFSGGYKAVFPGIANLEAIMHYHRAEAIGHPRSTWGVLKNNPTQAQIRQNGSLIPVDFCINVTLNHKHEITRFFCGAVTAVHETGCRFAKETAMVACPHPFPVVITSNSGHPLDLNLYQTVKGMAAAAEIVETGGLIITTARCQDGFPDHGNFTKLLLDHSSPEEIMETVSAPGFHMLDMWQAQKLAQVQLKADVALFSGLPAADIARVRLQPIADINLYLHKLGERLGADCPVAVLPEGPMTIPYLS